MVIADYWRNSQTFSIIVRNVALVVSENILNIVLDAGYIVTVIVYIMVVSKLRAVRGGPN